MGILDMLFGPQTNPNQSVGQIVGGYAGTGDQNVMDMLLRNRQQTSRVGNYLATESIPSRAAQAAWRGLTLPGRVAMGEVPMWVQDADGNVIQNPAVIADAAELAGTLSLGNLPAAAARPGTTLGIFGGRMAKNAPLDDLARAEAMEQAGQNADDIWRATGWGRGADGQWRFEIDDSVAALRHKSIGELPAQPGIASDFINHPALFSGYDDLAGIKTTIMTPKNSGGVMIDGRPNPALSGAFYADPQDGFPAEMGIGQHMYVSSGSDTPRGGILHELQHGVQDVEGFARGGSPEGMAYYVDEAKAAAQKSLDDAGLAREAAQVFAKGDTPADVRAKIIARYAGMDVTSWVDDAVAAWQRAGSPDAKRFAKVIKSAELSAKDAQRMDTRVAYRRLAGEVEARNVAERRNMTPEQRRQTPPWLTEDVPRSQQIVRRR